MPQPPPSPTRAQAPPPPTEDQAPVAAGQKRHAVSECGVMGWGGVGQQTTPWETDNTNVDASHRQNPCPTPALGPTLSFL